MTAHTPGPWVIDNRSIYDGQNGLGMAPVSLGAVVAECPTAFSGHTIRAPETIGQPCPSKAELDAQGLANAHLVKAAPWMLAALELVAATPGFEPDEPYGVATLAAIAIAKGSP